MKKILLSLTLMFVCLLGFSQTKFKQIATDTVRALNGNAVYIASDDTLNVTLLKFKNGTDSVFAVLTGDSLWLKSTKNIHFETDTFEVSGVINGTITGTITNADTAEYADSAGFAHDIDSASSGLEVVGVLNATDTVKGADIYASDDIIATDDLDVGGDAVVVGGVNSATIQILSGAKVDEFQTTITDSDTKLATSGAVVDYVTDTIDDYLLKANDTATNLVVTTDFYWANGLGKLDADSFYLKFPYSTGTPGLYSFNWGGSAGLPNQTTGNRGVSFGAGDTSSGSYSFTHGIRSTASGAYSFAYGDQSTSSGEHAFTFGEDDTASGDRSTAFGYRNGSSGTNSFTAGTNNRATGASAFALGGYNLASGQYSFATNWTNEATGKASSAFGTTTYAHDYIEAVFGRYNVKGTGSETSWVAGERLFSVGNGASDGARNDAFLIYKNGNISMGAEFGTDVTNSIFTFGNNLQGNSGSVAAGNNFQFSLGSSTSSENDYAFSFGEEDTASGIHSFAVGNAVTATGSRTTAFGANIEAQDFHEFVIGRFNVVSTGSKTSWVATDKLFVVANGTGLGNKNNAFEILKNGNTTIDGNATINDTTNISTLGFDGQYVAEYATQFPDDSVKNNTSYPQNTTGELLEAFHEDSIFSEGKLALDTITPSSKYEGNLYYDANTRSMTFINDISNFEHNLGYELVTRVYNNTGVTINNGQVVRIVGNYKEDGKITPTVRLAGNSSVDSTLVLGMATASITTGNYGIVTLRGEVKGLNTTFCANDSCMFYLGTGGNLIATSPEPPKYSVLLGQIYYSDADSGRVFFNPSTPEFNPSPHISADTARWDSTVDLTQNVFSYLPIGAFSVEDEYGYSTTGDSIQSQVAGHVTIAVNLSYTGNIQGDVWRKGIFLNGVEQHSVSRSTSGTSVGNSTIIKTLDIAVNDWISFKMTNESADRDPEINDFAYEIIFLHE